MQNPNQPSNEPCNSCQHVHSTFFFQLFCSQLPQITVQNHRHYLHPSRDLRARHPINKWRAAVSNHIKVGRIIANTSHAADTIWPCSGFVRWPGQFLHKNGTRQGHLDPGRKSKLFNVGARYTTRSVQNYFTAFECGMWLRGGKTSNTRCSIKVTCENYCSLVSCIVKLKDYFFGCPGFDRVCYQALSLNLARIK